MTDITDRLRAQGGEVCCEAADTIDRLRTLSNKKTNEYETEMEEAWGDGDHSIPTLRKKIAALRRELKAFKTPDTPIHR